MKTFLLVLLLSTVAAACYRSPIGMPLPGVTRFEIEWKNYSRLKSNKALAIAGDRQGLYVAGYAYAQPSKEVAEELALQACEARRTDRRIETPCKTFAIDHSEVEVETANSLESIVR
jgi:hypothetical protein